MSKETGGPAFPTTVTNGSKKNVEGLSGDQIPAGTATFYAGQTMRDAFAIAAMPLVSWYGDAAKSSPAKCYEIADAMLAARGAA